MYTLNLLYSDPRKLSALVHEPFMQGDLLYNKVTIFALVKWDVRAAQSLCKFEQVFLRREELSVKLIIHLKI